MSQSVVDSPSPTKSEKKHKKDKKRSREEAEEVPAVEDAPKKHKKSKSESLETETTEKKKKSKKSKKDDEDVEEEAPAKKEKKKSKKSKEEPMVEEEQEEEEAAVASESEAEEKKKRKSKDKKEKKDKKDKKKRQASATPELETTTADDAMDVDTTTSFPTDDVDFPFYTQVHSLYVPFYPCGFDKPLTNVAAQHLEPLLNHYSPVLRGVLLRYTNLNLSERPVQASVINPPTDETPALLRSVDEYAVGFAYLTFDAHMFKPARGKWMEGVVQLQSEGHIGVQCWGRFNASIEAKRLPKGWKWVDLKGDKSYNQQEEEEQEEEEQGEEEEDQLDGEELQVVEQVHTTGYWVDASGKKVSGKVRFRIKNFDVGLAGDYGYLSLEGTFLNDEDERALQKEERELERKRRSRQNPGGLLRPMSRRVPEFSMTKFGKEEEEEDAGQRTVFAKVTGKEGDVTPDD
ncbi:hypothetical protein B0H65DRAFT_145790 [Neurospora tetraspora]|uniref:DNA-directed RNA polymerase subunit n=1 Tax=Neurospora tetraspora TaxID=94610 RepID=A0AAE0JMK8_9PEZI|nr:hypothetical protein B0H65DRAFT_145790 [Neurospora tetraspora]